MRKDGGVGLVRRCQRSRDLPLARRSLPVRAIRRFKVANACLDFPLFISCFHLPSNLISSTSVLGAQHDKLVIETCALKVCALYIIPPLTL